MAKDTGNISIPIMEGKTVRGYLIVAKSFAKKMVKRARSSGRLEDRVLIVSQHRKGYKADVY
jgi:hypothetical protein